MKTTISEKILSIRAAAGNPCNTCPTCGRAPSAPYRRYDAQGRVTEGCIDATHTGRLVGTSESNRWHMRPVAEVMRRAELKRIGDR